MRQLIQRLRDLVSSVKLVDVAMYGAVILAGIMLLDAWSNSQQQPYPRMLSSQSQFTPGLSRYDFPNVAVPWSVEELSDYVENFCHVVEVPGDRNCRGYDGQKEVMVPCGIKGYRLSCDTRRAKDASK